MTTFDPVAPAWDAIVVGGGLAGLTAAALLGRAGLEVVVLERSGALGGRARTTETDGFHLNLGPHALYRNGAAAAALEELGIALPGGVAPAEGLALRGDGTFRLPTGPRALALTRLLGPSDKLALGRFFATVGRHDPATADDVPLGAWLARAVPRPRVREVVEAIVRLSTYTHAPDRLSAGAALRQLVLGLGGVRYLDGGWGAMVDALAARARQAGARIRTSSRVTSVARVSARWEARLPGGEVLSAPQVVLATPPEAVARLVQDAPAHVTRWSDSTRHVRAACLDVAVPSLPNPRTAFALGIDVPLYYSVHSQVAALTPSGAPDAAVVHLGRYLPVGQDTDPDRDRRQLEALFERLQPGALANATQARFLPSMTVQPIVPLATEGGTRGRPRATHPALPGLALAGDWVGDEGMLADTAFASARRAAKHVATTAPEVRAAA